MIRRAVAAWRQVVRVGCTGGWQAMSPAAARCTTLGARSPDSLDEDADATEGLGE
jgi:hypothetical protein